MWAHYGDKHKGVCVELDKCDFLQENISLIHSDLLRPINYKEFDPTKSQEKHKEVNLDTMKKLGKEKYLREHLGLNT